VTSTQSLGTRSDSDVLDPDAIAMMAKGQCQRGCGRLVLVPGASDGDDVERCFDEKEQHDRLISY